MEIYFYGTCWDGQYFVQCRAYIRRNPHIVQVGDIHRTVVWAKEPMEQRTQVCSVDGRDDAFDLNHTNSQY